MSRRFSPLRNRRGRIALAALAVSSLALSACQGAPRDEPPAAADFSSAAPKATKPVDTASWNVFGEPTSLDPMKAFSSKELSVETNVCEGLMTFTADGELVPNLATSIDTSDPTSLVVHLREKVSFSDGKPMTAEDVKFSLTRIMDPASGSYWSTYASGVSSVKVTDPRTVTISLKKPDAVLPRLLATPLGQVVEKAHAEQAGDALGSPRGGIVCTGPYALQDWSKGDSLTLVANDKWWNAKNDHQLTERVKFTFITNDNTLTSALLNGDVDGTYTVPSGAPFKRLSKASNGTVHLGPSTSERVLIPTQLTGSSALADPKVREALAKTIDYQGLLATQGPTVDPLRALMPPGTFGYAKDVFQKAYDAFPEPTRDIEAAKKLLADAGKPTPTVVLAVPSSSADFVATAEAIQSNAKEAGFNVQIESMTDADFYPLFSDAKARSKVDAFISDWLADVPDPLSFYAQLATPGSGVDFGGYDDPQVRALLGRAVGTADDDARAELTVEAQDQIMKDRVWLPLSYVKGALFLNDRLAGATSYTIFSFYAPWLATLGGR